MKLIKELIHRRIPHIIGSYLIAGTSLILFVDWLVNRYTLPEYYTTLCLFGVIAILHSVIILAYFHGAPGKDQWNMIEKIGVPVNIIFLLLILALGHRSNWWFEESVDNIVRKYIINISSSEYFIDKFQSNYGFNYVAFSPDKYIVSTLDDSLIDEIRIYIQQKITSDYANQNLEVLVNFNSIITETLDTLTYHQEGGLQEKDLPIFKDVLTKNKPKFYTEGLDALPNYGLFRILLYNIQSIDGSEFFISGEGAVQTVKINSWRNPDGNKYYYEEKSIKELKDDVYGYISGAIKDITFSTVVGEVIEIIDDELIKIKQHNPGILKKRIKLISSRNYYWSKGGAEMRIDDLNHMKEYYKKVENHENIAKMDEQISLINKNLTSNFYNDRTSTNMSGVISYIMQVKDIYSDSLVIAKIIGPEKPLYIVRIGDLIHINE